MIKTILVCTDGSEFGTVAARYGIHLAKQLDAALVGLHVLDSRMLEGPLMADISGWIGAQPYGAQLQQFRELLQNRGDAVVKAFDDLCASEGITPETWLRMGHPSRVILQEEIKAELVIIGQKGEHAELGGDMIGSNADRVSRNSIKPCLVVGPRFEPVRGILCGYDGSAHASEALHVAVELAQAMGVPLHVLTVRESDEGEDEPQTVEDVRRITEAHHVPAQALFTDGEPNTALLERAKAVDANLIVVGAHGHGRIREMFLGSTTTQLVSSSELPVMLVR